MRGGYGKREFFDVCLSFVSKCAKGGKGPYLEEDGYVSRSLEGWEEDFASLYIPLSLSLVSAELGVSENTSK